MADNTAPCEWPIRYTQCDPNSKFLALEKDEAEIYETMAIEHLWRWTGRRFGTCTVEARPCRQDCDKRGSTFWGTSGGGSGSPWTPVLISGNWFNISCGACGDSCDCSPNRVASLRLPGPISSVTEVMIDGTILDPSKYAIEASRYLLRTDGGAWPICNDYSRDPSQVPEPGADVAWSVTYERGVNVPVGGQVAAGILAEEFFKAACRDSSCQLPQRLQSLSRQGVAIGILDTFEDIDTGHTGIWLIDNWVASVTNSPSRSRVYSPDIRRKARTVRKV